MDILLRNVIVDDSNELVDIAIENGTFKQIGKNLEGTAAREIDGKGKVVIPGLVESHIHLDKALIADRLPNKSGTLQEALSVTAKLKSTFTREDVMERAERALQMIIERGTTHIRTHSEFDPIGGFHGFEVIMELKEKYKDFVDMQVVAFPQEGIIKSPGTEDLMYRAMDLGADVVGGIPYNDTDAKDHLDIVFEIAKKYDKDIDLHQDFFDDAEKQTIEMVAQKTIDEGYIGRVSVGHLTSLGAVPSDQLKPIIELMAKAEINVMALPMTDLHLGGRHDDNKVRRAVTPIRKLRDGGVNVVIATNNIRNPFTPYGNGDLLQAAMLAIPVAHLGGADDLPTVLPMVTTGPAKALKFDDYGIEEGKAATLVLLDSTRYQDAIIDIPDRLLVLKRGKVTVELDKKLHINFPK
ncbi:amidohydrolase family protein [Jeotgalibaca sp. MA1X17-3]|uniref:amidohydrolase family protein n=1 Tax=Jeotgalibaca sp. MA1X17-3 TaxID=2908211 RepID=UPI001F1DE408|nr:amidohydrolase family protein [Jeotgalibaca sp. MA1X17-3]UJF16158.1 amidohydrolase family protein [Jeotgalibaca sp. MA1X17-3]